MGWRKSSQAQANNFFVIALFLFNSRTLAAEAPCQRGEVCERPPEADAEAVRVQLLQTALQGIHIDTPHMLTSSDWDEVARTGSNRTTGRCIDLPLTGVEARIHIESLRMLGFFPELDDACSSGSSASLLETQGAVSVHDEVSSFTGSAVFFLLRPLGWIVAIYLAVYFYLVFWMIWSMTRSSNGEDEVARARKGTYRPEQESWEKGFLSWVGCAWVTPWIVRWGTPSHTITKIRAEELGGCGDVNCEAANSFKDFWKIWETETAKGRAQGYGMYWVILRQSTMRKILQIQLAGSLSQIMAYIVPTFAIDWALKFVANTYKQRLVDPDSVNQSSLLRPVVFMMFLLNGYPMVMTLFNTICYLMGTRMSIRLEGALGNAVYRKALRLPPNSEYDLQPISEADRHANGGMLSTSKYSLVALVNSDITGSLCGMHIAAAKVFMELPILLFLILMLVTRLGWAALVAAGSTYFSMYFILRVSTLQIYFMMGCQGIMGGRLHYLQENLFGIRLIKSYGWEPYVKKRCDSAREQELWYLWWFLMVAGTMYAFIICYPRIVTVGGLAAFCSIYHDVQSQDIFVLIQVLNAFKGCASMFVSLVPTLLACGPSIWRLEKFFMLEECAVPGDKREVAAEQPCLHVWPSPSERNADAEKPSLRIQGDFEWPVAPPAKPKPALFGLDLHIKNGELVAVLGEVGSGKTTLLNALLGELTPTGDSTLEIPPKIAYHSQVPHIIEGTLKENVLYHSSFDAERYNEAIFDAALRSDLEILPGGDEVPIGSRGIALSGGQRARVSLARAAYAHDCEAVILDDPFSSVDGPTGNHLMEHFLMGPLLENTTRVVVCQPERHRMHYFDQVLIMKEGRIAVKGPPEFVTQSPEYLELLASTEAELASTLAENQEAFGADSTPDARGSGGKGEVKGRKEEAVELRDDEFEGRADWTTIQYYFQIGTYRYIIGSFLLFLTFTLLSNVGDIVLARWATSSVLMEGTKGTPVPSALAKPPMWYIKVSSSWFCASMVAFVFMWYLGTQFSLLISKAIHENLMTKLMQAPIDRFYDKTPVGRIMNRMASDMSDIDQRMFQKLIGSVGTSISLVVPFIYIHYCMPFYFTLGTIPFYYQTFVMIRYYTNVMMPLRYLVSVSRSQMTTYVAEVESGCITARAYQVQEALAYKQSVAMDDMLKSDFASSSVRRWVVNRINVMYAFFLCCVGLFGVFVPGIDVGQTSLCLMNVIYFVMQIDLYLDTITAMQFECISLNRLHEWCVGGLPQERAGICDGDEKYATITTKLPRRTFVGWSVNQEGEHGIEILDADGEVIMKQVKGTEALVASQAGFKSLAPEDWAREDWEVEAVAKLKNTTDWHRLVTANEATKDAKAIAEELCKGLSEHVLLVFQSKWLAHGVTVEISDLCAGYSDIPNDVLKCVNMSIDRRQKAAIAGTTGCGKSTTLLCILRILEPRGGRIEIEGVDIQSLGLLTLRRELGLVPQDPVMFSGTIRSNLDPFEEYTDDKLWAALRSVRLHKYIWQLGAGLASEVKMEGDNLSFGQRQLLCLGRMILRQPSLILLDEATSAIDPHTQELVQETIMQGFPNSTMICIAHRLETIIDFDQVFVMQKGVVLEKGNPRELASTKGALFAKMIGAKAAITDVPKAA